MKSRITAVIINDESVPVENITTEKVCLDRHDCLIDKVSYGSEELFSKSEILKVPSDVDIKTNCNERRLKKQITVDPCLAEEIEYLWGQGIVTTGCCCGHNIGFAYIGVEEEFIPKMKELGYKTQLNPMDVTREDSFIPKSLK